MQRLKVLGTWIVLVIAFYLFSNIMIKLYLNKIKASEVNNNKTQIVQEEKNNINIS